MLENQSLARSVRVVVKVLVTDVVPIDSGTRVGDSLLLFCVVGEPLYPSALEQRSLWHLPHLSLGFP